MICFRTTIKFVTQKNTFGPQISNKPKKDVIFEVIIIDGIKPIGQCSLKDLKTLTICFLDINSMKKRTARKKG